MALSYTVTDTTKLSSTAIYGEVLCELAEKHKDIVALTADLGSSTKIGTFGERFPDRFFNVGIAEQNMFGIAAGLAKGGFVAFTSTFGIFNSTRALDQVHTDICYQNVNVKMLGTHAGLSFGQAGSTHHSTEDVGIMRTMANLRIIVPADGVETAMAIRCAYETPGPFYIRLNRGFDQRVYIDENYGFALGKAVELYPGTDITVIACGSCVNEALQAAKLLDAEDHIKVRVLDMHTIKPLDEEAVRKAVGETRRVITVEDHSIIGGLGSAVAEVIAGYGKGCAFKRLGVPDIFAQIGLHEDLMAIYGIDTNGILAAVREIMGRDFEEDDNWDDEV
jgi:transketolase